MNTEFNIFNRKIKFSQIANLIEKLAKIGLILLILISMLLLNHSVLLSPDDYNYTYVQGRGDRTKVDSIANAIETGKFFYHNWTGRVIPHVLIGIFRSLPEVVYEISNTIVFLIFIILITKVLNKKSKFLTILSVFGYLAFSKMFGEKFAWISGSFNYLWPCTFMIIFIYYLYNYFIGNKKLNLLQKIALILFSFVTAFTHENIAFVGGAFFTCLILFNIKQFMKFDKNKKIAITLMFIMFCLGAAATIFAPGNFKRMSTEQSGFSWSFLGNYIENKFVLLNVLLSMVIAFVCENFEILKSEKFSGLKKANYSTIKIEVLNFIVPSLIATLPFAIIGYFPPRAFLAYEVMFMIVLAKNMYIFSEKIGNNYIVISVFSIILSLVVFGRFSPSTLGQINYIIPYKNSVTAQYEEAQKNGEKDVLVSKFEYINWIHKEDYINISNFFPEFDYHNPVNALISQYYGFDRLTAIGDNDYLIELEVDTEGINPYYVIDKNTEKNIYTMEYDNLIRYTVPKEKLGEYLLDCRENGLENKIINCRVRYIGGEMDENQINLNNIIIK